jgi:hypothetical protein
MAGAIASHLILAKNALVILQLKRWPRLNCFIYSE